VIADKSGRAGHKYVHWNVLPLVFCQNIIEGFVRYFM
jgi:hypothetical protein